jgi:predicted small integral membrane protein
MMASWKKISLILFVAGLLGLLLSVFISLTQMTPTYAPPGVMVSQTTGRGDPLVTGGYGVAIIFLASLVSFFIGWRQEKPDP